MKVLLFIWIIVNGVDRGPPPVEISSMEECRKIEAKWNAKEVPQGVEKVAVGCVTERVQGVKS